MAKITFMGAGSTVFVKNVLGDILVSPVLSSSEINLYDIDAVRLKESERMLTSIRNNLGSRAIIKSYCGAENRKAALDGADYVINAIQVGGYDPCTITDFEIPKIWSAADDRGHTGCRRCAPWFAYYSRDAGLCLRYERYVPGRVVLNYTNPMAILTGAMITMSPI